jgi:hypothetical protein
VGIQNSHLPRQSLAAERRWQQRRIDQNRMLIEDVKPAPALYHHKTDPNRSSGCSAQTVVHSLVKVRFNMPQEAITRSSADLLLPNKINKFKFITAYESG